VQAAPEERVVVGDDDTDGVVRPLCHEHDLSGEGLAVTEV
jgi:hypothetical protein